VNLPRGGCQNRFVTSEKEMASKLKVETQIEKNKREGEASMLVQNGKFNALKRSRMQQQLVKDSLMRII
jgi:hypothetical protein